MSPDPDHRFELAIDLKHLETAHEVLLELGRVVGADDDSNSLDRQNKWRRLGDLALSQGQVALAITCAERSNDTSGLLLLYSSRGDRAGMISLAEQAHSQGRFNVAFLAYLLTGAVEQCLALLVEQGRVPEAAFMARTYMPSKIPSLLEAWRVDLKQVNEKAAEALADPVRYPNLFPDLMLVLL